jgi:hypothetical protein
LEDRIKYKIKEINKLAGRNVDIIVKKQKDPNNNVIYELSFKNDKIFNNVLKEIEKVGFTLKKDIFSMLVI